MNNLTTEQIKDIFLGIEQKGKYAKAGGILSPSGLKYFQGKTHKAVEQNPNMHSSWSGFAKEGKAKIAWIFENEGSYVGLILAYKVGRKLKITMQILGDSRATVPSEIYSAVAPTIEELEAYNDAD